MKRKGFTLVELLVVIAIIALLMGILMPALARVRELAQRVVCGTNCSGIVKAMLVYSNDTETGRFPRAGTPETTWADMTVSSSLYLLIRFDYCSAKTFVCKSDAGVSELQDPNPSLLFDFGGNHCSYAYHMPYVFGPDSVTYNLSGSSASGMAVVADRSPGAVDENSTNHQGDGQNVAYVDAHVKFQETPSCGINDDNIYTVGSDPVGTMGDGPSDPWDSFLVN